MTSCTLVALVADRQLRARLREAARGELEIRFLDSSADVPGAVAGLGTPAALIEVRPSTEREAIALVRLLRARYPRVPIIGYCDRHASSFLDPRPIQQAGAHTLAWRGTDDTAGTLPATLAAAAHRCASARVLDAVGPAVPADVRPLLGYALERADTPLGVTAVAAALGVDRRTLGNRLARAGAPTPQALLGWCRVIAATQMMTEWGWSAEQTALRLDFPCSAALRNLLKRYTGRTASQLRAEGGLRCVLPLFTRSFAPNDASRCRGN